jgi:hypothetical protein
MQHFLAGLLLCALALPAHAAIASWYGRESVPRTANGEWFNPSATAAHLPTVGQIFGRKFMAAKPTSGGYNGGVPIGPLVTERIAAY